MRKKYTLDLPTSLYDDIKQQASSQDRSIKEILRQCVQFGLTAMKIAQDPNASIIFRERIHLDPNSGKEQYQDTVVKFIL